MRVAVVGPGVDLDARPAVDPARVLALRAGSPRQAPPAVWLGRFVLGTARAADPGGRASSVRVVMAGDGPMRRAVMAEAADLVAAGAVVFPGAVASPASLLAAGDLVVLSSRSEGTRSRCSGGRAARVSTAGGVPDVLRAGRRASCAPGTQAASHARSRRWRGSGVARASGRRRSGRRTAGSARPASSTRPSPSTGACSGSTGAARRAVGRIAPVLKDPSAPRERLAPWLRKRLPAVDATKDVRELVADLDLRTVCQSARCPNQNECWSRKAATFMILGDICTRTCRFCTVPKGKPLPLDDDEPERVAEAARRMGLHHVVVTSVDRDELPDQGAGHFARTIRAIRAAPPPRSSRS
jgi:hypothetical protein